MQNLTEQYLYSCKTDQEPPNFQKFPIQIQLSPTGLPKNENVFLFPLNQNKGFGGEQFGNTSPSSSSYSDSGSFEIIQTEFQQKQLNSNPPVNKETPEPDQLLQQQPQENNYTLQCETLQKSEDDDDSSIDSCHQNTNIDQSSNNANQQDDTIQSLRQKQEEMQTIMTYLEYSVDVLRGENTKILSDSEAKFRQIVDESKEKERAMQEQVNSLKIDNAQLKQQYQELKNQIQQQVNTNANRSVEQLPGSMASLLQKISSQNMVWDESCAECQQRRQWFQQQFPLNQCIQNLPQKIRGLGGYCSRCGKKARNPQQVATLKAKTLKKQVKSVVNKLSKIQF